MLFSISTIILTQMNELASSDFDLDVFGAPPATNTNATNTNRATGNDFDDFLGMGAATTSFSGPNYPQPPAYSPVDLINPNQTSPKTPETPSSAVGTQFPAVIAPHLLCAVADADTKICSTFILKSGSKLV